MMNHLRKYFLSGLVVFLPISLTIYLFVLLIRFADRFLGKFADQILGRFLEPELIENFGFFYKLLTVIVGIYLIVLIGFLVTHYIGRKIYDLFEKIFVKLPFFRQVYPALKEMAKFLFSHDRVSSFKQVVLIEYPRKGIYSFGFVTNETASRKVSDIVQQEMCNVFVPSSPGPLTGFVVMLPKKDVIFTRIGVEEAFKFILSGGVVNPVPAAEEDASESL